MKNATATFKTAKDYPIGTKFRWVEYDDWWELVSYESIMNYCKMIHHYDNTLHEIRVNDDIFFSSDVEIIYPKSKNFNSLYEKLNGF